MHYRENDVHWMAGLLEGEGSFMVGPPSKNNLPIVSVEMTDKDVLERLASILNVRVTTLKPRSNNWKPTFRVRVHGRKAVQLMESVKPHMGSRRREQIHKALQSFAPQREMLTLEEVNEIHALNREGVPKTEIARTMGRSRSSVYKVLSI